MLRCDLLIKTSTSLYEEDRYRYISFINCNFNNNVTNNNFHFGECTFDINVVLGNEGAILFEEVMMCNGDINQIIIINCIFNSNHATFDMVVQFLRIVIKLKASLSKAAILLAIMIYKEIVMLYTY